MILDTNALSAWLDGDPVIEMKLSVASYVALSSIVMGEYRFGVLFSRNRAEYEQRIALVEGDLTVMGPIPRPPGLRSPHRSSLA